MKKTKIFRFIVIFVFIFILSIVVFYFVELKNNELIKIAVYPSSGGLSETYYFEIKSNGELLVEKGDRTGDDLTQNPFMERKNPYKDKNTIYDFQSKKIRLTEPELKKIYILTSDIVNTFYAENIPDVGVIFDSWSIQILYQGKTIVQDCFNEDVSQIQELVNELISVSPIEVDLHNFS